MPPLKLAILADDLTGALDTSAPFALAGLSVAVASAPDHVAEALAEGAEVVVAVTRSRHLPAGQAAAIAAEAAKHLAAHRPQLLFKKVDSRLKGNVAVETAALARAAGLKGLWIVPAVPDQGRFTVRGSVTGAGVSRPIPIAPLFAAADIPAIIIDASSQGELEEALVVRLVSDLPPPLLVGARGLGSALARMLGGRDFRPARPRLKAPRTLFAFGSRDPITEAQVEALAAAEGLISVRRCPGGELASDALPSLPLVLAASGEIEADPAAVGRRFAASVCRAITELDPAALVVGGGDTAAVVLDTLDARVLRPLGEAAPGLPWIVVERQDGRRLDVVLKSGGFGAPSVLADILAG